MSDSTSQEPLTRLRSGLNSSTDIRLADVAVKSIHIFNDNKLDILEGDYSSLEQELSLAEGIEFRGKKTITPSECIEVLRLDTWLEDTEIEIKEEE